MRLWAVWARRTFVGAALCAMLSGAGFSQRTGTGQQPVFQPSGQTPIESKESKDGPPPAIIERQVAQRNNERQKRLVADTDKLLELATQLHTDVGKTDKNILSLDVVKRADEIEKLAHAVKERMKG